MFMVPKNLIRFKAKRIADRISTRTSKTVAAITFGGWADDTKIKKYKEIKAALDAEGITYTNRFYYLGYNPPFEVFNRRNEVIVELQSVSIDPITK
jgi:hypothetical protein